MGVSTVGIYGDLCQDEASSILRTLGVNIVYLDSVYLVGEAHNAKISLLNTNLHTTPDFHVEVLKFVNEFHSKWSR